MFIKRLRTNIPTLPMAFVLVCIMALGLSACGDAGTSSSTNSAPSANAPDTAAAAGATAAVPTEASSPAGSASGGTAQEVKAVLKEWAVELPSTDLTAGNYSVVVNNQGTLSHNLKVLDASGNELAGTPNFKQDEGAKNFEVDLKAGTYTFLCTIAGHPEQGMKTTVTVK